MTGHPNSNTLDEMEYFSKLSRIAENDTTNELIDRLHAVPIWYFTSMCICITSLGINGMLLNGLVIRSFISKPIFHAPYNLIVLNLIFAEIILSSFGLGMDFQALIQNGWVLGNELCVVSGALVTTAAFASAATICALSVFRYGSIFHYGNFEENVPTVRAAMKIIVLVWMYAMSLSLPPLFGWGSYTPDRSGLLGCSFDWHSTEADQAYIIYSLILGFVTPSIIIPISSIMTCIDGGVLSNPFVSYNTHNLSANRAQRRNIFLVVAMNLAYFMCWSPYAVSCFINLFVSKIMPGTMLAMIPPIAMKMSVCFSPLLYVASNPQFHRKFNKEMPGASTQWNTLRVSMKRHNTRVSETLNIPRENSKLNKLYEEHFALNLCENLEQHMEVSDAAATRNSHENPDGREIQSENNSYQNNPKTTESPVLWNNIFSRLDVMQETQV